MKAFAVRVLAKVQRILVAAAETIPARFWRLIVNVQRLALPADPRPQTLAIVRVDAIGDYVLFRGCLRVLKTSGVYDGFTLTVVGNRQWRSVAEALDSDVVDEWIWVDPTRYSRSPWYRAQVFAELPSRPFDTLVHPTFSRTIWADCLADDLLARRKIAGTGDRVNQRWSWDRSRQIYTQLLPVDHHRVLFEVDRNWEFFERLLETPLSRPLPRIDPSLLAEDSRIPSEKYVVFHLDASRPEKEWPFQNYVVLGEHLRDHTDLSVVLLGQGASRSPWPASAFSGRVIDLRDQTTLVQAAFVLSRASGFVGNDSALLHLALAVGTPAVGVCFGQHFGRFAPYPRVEPHQAAFVFPPTVEAHRSNPETLQSKYADGSFEDIRTITVEAVVTVLDPILSRTQAS